MTLAYQPRVLALLMVIACTATSCSCSSSKPAASPPSNTTTAPTLPARHRLDTSRLVVYQVWLNYYARNVAVGQMSSDVFANAAAHLPAIASMGVTAIQLSPIQPFGNETTVGATYSIKDYYAVNPGYSGIRGTTERARQLGIEALKRYIDRAHGLGLRVLMDCVYHSTEVDNVLVSQHPEFYERDKRGRISTNQFGFAVLDYSKRAVRSYMIDVTRYWSTTVGFDGCRADLATSIPVSFWAQLNNEMKRASPGWLMIGEVPYRLAEYAGTYSGPGISSGETYDRVYAFDAIYGVEYTSALRQVIDGHASVASLRRAWSQPDRSIASTPPGTVLYRGVDNHDQNPRAVRLAGGNAGMVAAMAVSFTIGGIPFIFNGQEIGDGAPTSFYSQTLIDWVDPPHPGNAQSFKTLLALARTRPALADGTTIWCDTTGPPRAAAYMRADARDRVLVVVNLSAQRWTGRVMLPTAGAPPTEVVDLLSGAAHAAAGSSVRLSLSPYAYLITAVR